MKFKLNIEIFDEKLIKVVAIMGQKLPEVPLTFGTALIQVLNTPEDPRKPALPASDKVKRYGLIGRVLDALGTKAETIDLSLDDIGVVKPLVDENCSTLVHGRMMEILNNPLGDSHASD